MGEPNTGPLTWIALAMVLGSVVLCMFRMNQFVAGFKDWRDQERSARNNRNLLTAVICFQLSMATFMAVTGEWLWCIGLVGVAGIVWFQRWMDGLSR